MTSKNRTRATRAMAAAMALTTIVGASAYFTDRVEFNAKVKSGTVGITEDATSNWLDQMHAGPQSLDNINPGDSRSLAFTVKNTGNKAVDVRHTIKLSVEDAAGNPKALSQDKDVNGASLLQFDIFKASDVVTMSGNNPASYNGGYVLKAGAEPVFSSDSVDGTTNMGASRTVDHAKGIVTYYFADTILDGCGEAAETKYSKAEHVETTLGATDAVIVDDVVNGSTVKYDYVLIFRDTTLNDFQGCLVHAELVVEAKQHLNTNSSWQNVEKVEYVLSASGIDTQNTTIQTAPNNQNGVLNSVTDGTAGKYNNMVAH